MEAIREVTVWKGTKTQPNHTYLMDGSRAVAYVKWSKGEPFYFKNPLPLDKRGRKFVTGDIKLFKALKVKTNTIQVQGSKGNTYTVDPDAKTCTCPGFTYRGSCKHITEFVK